MVLVGFAVEVCLDELLLLFHVLLVGVKLEHIYLVLGFLRFWVLLGWGLTQLNLRLLLLFPLRCRLEFRLDPAPAEFPQRARVFQGLLVDFFEPLFRAGANRAHAVLLTLLRVLLFVELLVFFHAIPEAFTAPLAL